MNVKIKVLSVFIAAGLAVYAPLYGQPAVPGSQNTRELTYKEFLERLMTQNLEYAAEKYNLAIAGAETEAAGIRPDPELSFAAYDNQNRRMKMGYGFEAELSWDLELGGKRGARIKLAEAEQQLTELELKQFFAELRTGSTLYFLEALKNKTEFDALSYSYSVISELAKADSARYEQGKIRRSAASQSRLEALSIYNDMREAADVWRYSLIEIKNLISGEMHDTLFVPAGDLKNLDRKFTLGEITEIAQNNYEGSRIKQQGVAVAKQKVDLARAERVMDIGLLIGIENSAFEKNIIGPSPGRTALKAGVSVPLKFSNNKEAGLKTAILQQKQAELDYTRVRLNIENRVTGAFRSYESRRARVKELEPVAREAEDIFREEVEAYLNEESSLSDVLNAERTFRKIQNDYISSLFKYAAALIELESSAGIWDVDF